MLDFKLQLTEKNNEILRFATNDSFVQNAHNERISHFVRNDSCLCLWGWLGRQSRPNHPHSPCASLSFRMKRSGMRNLVSLSFPHCAPIFFW